MQELKLYCNENLLFMAHGVFSHDEYDIDIPLILTEMPLICDGAPPEKVYLFDGEGLPKFLVDPYRLT